MYVGFDIFDTLLARKVSPPSAVFERLAKTLRENGMIKVPPHIFAKERVQSERKCLQSIGARANIYDIYREVCSSFSMDASLIDGLVDAELAIEMEMTYPLKDNLQILSYYRDLGRKIVFISDMYLPSTYLTKLLEHHGILVDGDRLYVSCEVGKDKSGSGLFSFVLNDLDIPPSALAFFGNDAIADVRGAKRVGLDTRYLPIGNSTRFEKILEEGRFRSDGYTAALAGAAKFARFEGRSRSSSNDGLSTVAAGVAAPMLVSYTLWILQMALQHNIQRLYFFSRDGQVMLEIAKRLVSKLGLEVDLRYLYVSRPALSRAFDIPSNKRWYLSDLALETSAFDILARVSATDENHLSALANTGYKTDGLHDPIAPGDLELITDFIESNAFKDIHANVVTSERAQVEDYLRGQGVFDDLKIGVVDIGWSGTLHELVATAIVENGGSAPMGFVFGAKKKSSEFSDKLNAYFFDLREKTGYSNPFPGSEFYFLSEMFCCADHGTVTSFEVNAGDVVPQLEKTWGNTIREWDYDAYRDIIYAFAEFLDVKPGDYPLLARKEISELLIEFWKNPTQEEAEAWGRFPWDSGMGSEAGSIPIAKRLSLKSFLRAMRKGGAAKNEVIWTSGSMAQSSAWLRSFYSVASRSKRYVWKLRELLRR